MLKGPGLSNNRAWLHKELGFLALLLLAGCTVIEVPAPKQWNCTLPVDNAWMCKSVNVEKCFYSKWISCEEMVNAVYQ